MYIFITYKEKNRKLHIQLIDSIFKINLDIIKFDDMLNTLCTYECTYNCWLLFFGVAALSFEFRCNPNNIPLN